MNGEPQPAEQEGKEKNEQDDGHELIASFLQRRPGTAFDYPAAAVPHMLAAAEASCCSFFTFIPTVTGQDLTLDITVPSAHVTALDALTGQAEAAARA